LVAIASLTGLPQASQPSPPDRLQAQRRSSSSISVEDVAILGTAPLYQELAARLGGVEDARRVAPLEAHRVIRVHGAVDEGEVALEGCGEEVLARGPAAAGGGVLAVPQEVADRGLALLGEEGLARRPDGSEEGFEVGRRGLGARAAGKTGRPDEGDG
jgi:hypothetical protein